MYQYLWNHRWQPATDKQEAIYLAKHYAKMPGHKHQAYFRLIVSQDDIRTFVLYGRKWTQISQYFGLIDSEVA